MGPGMDFRILEAERGGSSVAPLQLDSLIGLALLVLIRKPGYDRIATIAENRLDRGIKILLGLGSGLAVNLLEFLQRIKERKIIDGTGGR